MSKYIRIYETLCPDDKIARDDPRRDAIMDEMRAIHKAKSEDDAVSVIAWWNAWPNPQHQTVIEFVQAAREMMSNVKVTGSPALSASPRGLPGSVAG